MMAVLIYDGFRISTDYNIYICIKSNSIHSIKYTLKRTPVKQDI